MPALLPKHESALGQFPGYSRPRVARQTVQASRRETAQARQVVTAPVWHPPDQTSGKEVFRAIIPHSSQPRLFGVLALRRFHRVGICHHWCLRCSHSRVQGSKRCRRRRIHQCHCRGKGCLLHPSPRLRQGGQRPLHRSRSQSSRADTRILRLRRCAERRNRQVQVTEGFREGEMMKNQRLECNFALVPHSLLFSSLPAVPKLIHALRTSP